jgi:hypothetical protein
MDILLKAIKYLKTNHLWVKLKYGDNKDFDPAEISDPIVKEIKEVKDAIDNREVLNPNDISLPIVKAQKETTEAVKGIKFPELPEPKDKMKVELEGVSLVAIKGDKGDKPIPGEDFPIPKDGKTPVKGTDYFTKSEQKEFLKTSTPIKGKHYFDGKDGYTPVKNIDYFDGTDGKDADEEKIKEAVLKEIPIPEDGSPDSPEDVRGKLETLKGLERLDAKHIKNIPFGGGGVQEFYKLKDTPPNYQGQQGKFVAVKANQNGLEFVTQDLSGYVTNSNAIAYAIALG